MLYGEIIAVCSQIHKKHVNTPCGLNVEIVNVKPGGGTYSDHWALTITGSPYFMASFTPCCFNVPCQFTALLSLRPLLFGVTAFRWPRTRTLPSVYGTHGTEQSRVAVH